ncbi:DUF3080 family protein [Halomonas urumqiensis]|uniref:DUF3080 domain-containing protein n=1 Tax=Halomonas urumqiensis TaxID=1684789 RepID=A0A2N7UGY7_9GAMM|nr:DUF3080 family protein [Halomonas urumqiensis]PMR79737.1 DUF3080 domain-containing protein [Halomonas urumqiensis]PTB00940.1 DUF3080 domain-containing protein [Halomonas urumqiensis]GHE22990.1 hypothetical protein GCM10017767_35110 [Halomonas urumqiensis]
MDNVISRRNSHPPRWQRLVALLLASMALGGCGNGSDDSDQLLIDYQGELARHLDLEPPMPQAPGNIGAFPPRRERLLDVPDTREGMLDIYALRECHITTMVAERNSALGRVAPPSQRWLYELELWQRLDACLNSNVPDSLAESDRQRLERLTAVKTEQLPRVSWNAMLESEEFEKSFSRASSVLPQDQLAPPEAQLEALAFLHALVRHQFEPQRQPDTDRLEEHLQALRERPYSGELLRTLLLAEQRLREASNLLSETLARHDSCQGLEDFSASPEDSPVGADLATWLEQLDKAGTRWLGSLDRLLAAHPEQAEPVHDYARRWLSLDAADAVLPAFRDAREAHLDLRQTLAKRCG